MPRTLRSPAEAEFVEKVSAFYGEIGFPRIAGRILGWLLICDPAAQSAAELGEALQASKGSISTMTRLLVKLGLLERTGMPGRRENFFRIRPGVWTELLGSQLQKVTAARELAECGLALLEGGREAGRRGRLEEMRDLYAFMEREMPALLARWAEERSARSKALLAG